MPRRGRPHAGDDEFVLFTLLNEIAIINQLASTEFERVLPHGLTLAQFTVLNHFVRTGDGKTPGDLARIMQVTRGTMTSTIGRLEDKGFIRVVPDAADGRSKRVYLTPRGRAARDTSIATAGTILRSLAEEFPPDAARRLLPTLIELRTVFDTRRGGGASPAATPRR